jgi:hypothetical protein
MTIGFDPNAPFMRRDGTMVFIRPTGLGGFDVWDEDRKLAYQVDHIGMADKDMDRRYDLMNYGVRGRASVDAGAPTTLEDRVARLEQLEVERIDRTLSAFYQPVHDAFYRAMRRRIAPAEAPDPPKGAASATRARAQREADAPATIQEAIKEILASDQPATPDYAAAIRSESVAGVQGDAAAADKAALDAYALEQFAQRLGTSVNAPGWSLASPAQRGAIRSLAKWVRAQLSQIATTADLPSDQ